MELILEINWKVSGKSPSICKLNHTLINNPWVTKETKSKTKNYYEQNENETHMSKFVKCSLRIF